VVIVAATVVDAPAVATVEIAAIVVVTAADASMDRPKSISTS